VGNCSKQFQRSLCPLGKKHPETHFVDSSAIAALPSQRYFCCLSKSKWRNLRIWLLPISLMIATAALIGGFSHNHIHPSVAKSRKWPQLLTISPVNPVPEQCSCSWLDCLWTLLSELVPGQKFEVQHSGNLRTLSKTKSIDGIGIPATGITRHWPFHLRHGVRRSLSCTRGQEPSLDCPAGHFSHYWVAFESIPRSAGIMTFHGFSMWHVDGFRAQAIGVASGQASNRNCVFNFSHSRGLRIEIPCGVGALSKDSSASAPNTG